MNANTPNPDRTKEILQTVWLSNSVQENAGQC